jgi:TRAP-type C4-dicarboxylate transport system permease small subunit
MKTQLLAGWTILTEGVAASAFALMFAAFVVQIFSRYVLNAPVSWSLEVCAIAYVWVVFWSCGLLVSERQQIVFDVIYQAIKPRSRRWLAIANTSALGLVFLAALPGTVDYVWFLRRRDSMMLQVPMHLVYACFVIFMIAVVVRSGLRVRSLLGKDWQKQL